MLSLMRRDDAVQENQSQNTGWADLGKASGDDRVTVASQPQTRSLSKRQESWVGMASLGCPHSTCRVRRGVRWDQWTPLLGLLWKTGTAQRPSSPEPHKQGAEQFPIPPSTKPTQRDPWERSMAVTKPASRPNTVLPFLEEAQTGTTSLLDSHMAPHPCSRRGS